MRRLYQIGDKMNKIKKTIIGGLAGIAIGLPLASYCRAEPSPTPTPVTYVAHLLEYGFERQKDPGDQSIQTYLHFKTKRCRDGDEEIKVFVAPVDRTLAERLLSNLGGTDVYIKLPNEYLEHARVHIDFDSLIKVGTKRACGCPDHGSEPATMREDLENLNEPAPDETLDSTENKKGASEDDY